MKRFKNFLNELYNVKELYGAVTLGSLFRKLGWKQIGTRSVFASVWSIPNKPYIVKAWTLDEAYENFLRYILSSDNRNNPHFPKIFGRMKSIPAVHLRSKKDDIVKLVKLEKLESLEQGSMEYKIIEKILSGKSYKNDDSDIFPQVKTFKETYEKLENQRQFHGYIDDLHMNNVMVRPSDGIIVIIDPWLSEIDYEDLKVKNIKDDKFSQYTKPYYLEKDAA